MVKSLPEGRFYELLETPLTSNKLAEKYAEAYEVTERWAMELITRLRDGIESGQVERIRRLPLPSGQVLYHRTGDPMADAAERLAEEDVGFGGPLPPCPNCGKASMLMTLGFWQWGVCWPCRYLWRRTRPGISIHKLLLHRASILDAVAAARPQEFDAALRRIVFLERWEDGTTVVDARANAAGRPVVEVEPGAAVWRGLLGFVEPQPESSTTTRPSARESR